MYNECKIIPKVFSDHKCHPLKSNHLTISLIIIIRAGEPESEPGFWPLRARAARKKIPGAGAAKK